MAILTNKRFVTDWNQFNLPSIPNNGDELIAEAVAVMRNDLRKCNFGDVFESQRIVNYRNGAQVFAVFGNTARELCNWALVDDETGREYAWRPAILDGIAFKSCPDEGSGGVLHWFWSDRLPDAWSLTWLSASGWVYTSELDQSPAEITDNICAEIAAGGTPLTGNNGNPSYQ